MAKRRARRYVALLRGVNVSGKHKLPMAAFREALTATGLEDVGTYIQSGNAVFTTPLTPTAVERQIEQTLRDVFHLDVPAIVRGAAAWDALTRDNPFLDESEADPKRVQLLLSKAPPPPGVETALEAYAKRGERITKTSDALWIHYPQGVGESKLVPAVLERCVGSPVTARNWRTVTKLRDLLVP